MANWTMEWRALRSEVRFVFAQIVLPFTSPAERARSNVVTSIARGPSGGQPRDGDESRFSGETRPRGSRRRHRVLGAFGRARM